LLNGKGFGIGNYPKNGLETFYDVVYNHHIKGAKQWEKLLKEDYHISKSKSTTQRV